MDKDTKKTINLFSRYLSILILGSFNLYLIYKILTPLTVNTVNTFLKIFTTTVLDKNMIQLSQYTIEIVQACVAGSAFFLLILLLLSIPNIKPKTRAYAILTATSVLFISNVVRILILVPLIGTSSFETIHWIFWHIVSTILVVAIYVLTIKFYKIKSIPIYSDIKYLKSLTKSRAKHKRKKKKK